MCRKGFYVKIAVCVLVNFSSVTSFNPAEGKELANQSVASKQVLPQNNSSPVTMTSMTSVADYSRNLTDSQNFGKLRNEGLDLHHVLAAVYAAFIAVGLLANGLVFFVICTGKGASRYIVVMAFSPLNKCRGPKRTWTPKFF